MHELLCDLDAEIFRARAVAKVGVEVHDSHPVDERPRGRSVDKSGNVDSSVENRGEGLTDESDAPAEPPAGPVGAVSAVPEDPRHG